MNFSPRFNNCFKHTEKIKFSPEVEHRTQKFLFSVQWVFSHLLHIHSITDEPFAFRLSVFLLYLVEQF